jgi:hypothetical protein
LDRWIDEQQGRKWFRREGERFVFAIPCAREMRVAFERMTGEVVDYRLSHYAQSRVRQAGAEGLEFVAKVRHSGVRYFSYPTREPDAGLPGTGFTARFQNSTQGWRVNPVQHITTTQPTVCQTR